MRKMMLAALAATMLCGSADAALLTFTISNGVGVGEAFNIESTAGQPNEYSGYVLFQISGDTLLNNGAYFDARSGNFGTGIIRPSGTSVEPTYDDYAPSSLVDISTMSLVVKAGDSFVTNNGNTVRITAATAAVPEPASWAMIIAGFGAVGTALRRRQRVSVTFA